MDSDINEDNDATGQLHDQSDLSSTGHSFIFIMKATSLIQNNLIVSILGFQQQASRSEVNDGK